MPHIFRWWAAERLAARFRPTVAKNSISTILHCFVAFVTWKHGADIANATTNRFGDHKLKNLIKTSLWQAWVWVAWIERGHQICVQKIYGDKSFESITDSQLKHRPWHSSWTVTPNSIIRHYRLSDLFMNWMSLLERIAEMNAWNQLTCPINLLSALPHIFEDGQLKGWQPHFQPTVAKSSISTILRRFEAVAA